MPTIKTINDFTIAVHTALSAAFPACSIEPVNVTKNNDVHRTGLTICPSSNKIIAPTIYTDMYFDAFQSGQPLETIIGQIVNTCMAALSCAEKGIDTNNIKDFTRIKDKICYKLVNKHMNRELLTTVPHRDYLDLSIVYYIRLAQTDNGLATLNVTDSLAHTWGVDEETLFSLASSNTPLLCRGCVMPVSDIFGGLLHAAPESDTYDSFDFTSVKPGELPIYVVTNHSNTYGAASILYSKLLNAIAEKLDSFYLLPASIHEIIIVPEHLGNPSELKQTVKEVNGTEVPEEEILSENCYYYDSAKHEIRMAV